MSVEPVLVVGATGTQGGSVVRNLLDRDVAVHALTRRPDSDAAGDLEAAGATVVEGNLDDRDGLADAMADVAGVHLVTTWDEGVDTEIDRGRRAVSVAEEAGVDHLVFSSVTGAEGSGVDVFESKGEIESHLRDADLDWTILRPAFFMQNFERQREAIREGTLSLPLEPGRSLQMVDVHDVGALAATAFERPEEYAGLTVDLAGDELTLDAMAARVADVAGLDVVEEHVPLDEYRERKGDRYGDMYRYLNDASDADLAYLRVAHDLSFTRFEEYLQRRWT